MPWTTGRGGPGKSAHASGCAAFTQCASATSTGKGKPLPVGLLEHRRRPMRLRYSYLFYNSRSPPGQVVDVPSANGSVPRPVYRGGFFVAKGGQTPRDRLRKGHPRTRDAFASSQTAKTAAKVVG